MSGPEHDPQFEDFLRRRSPMHRRLSDFDHAEPSLELDRLVLSRAREAIEVPAQPPYRATRWAMPVGLAATILIAFTIVLNVGRHERNADKRVGSPVTAPTAAAAPAESVAQVDATAPMMAAEASAASPPHDAFAEPQQARRERKAETIASARTDQPAPAVAQLAGKVAAPATESDMAPAAPVTLRSERALASNAQLARAAAPAAERASHPDAETWLREISRLRAEGKTAAAERELVAFRRAYPSHAGSSLAQPPTR